jgi:hypothetical protein
MVIFSTWNIQVTTKCILSLTFTFTVLILSQTRLEMLLKIIFQRVFQLCNHIAANVFKEILSFGNMIRTPSQVRRVKSAHQAEVLFFLNGCDATDIPEVEGRMLGWLLWRSKSIMNIIAC